MADGRWPIRMIENHMSMVTTKKCRPLPPAAIAEIIARPPTLPHLLMASRDDTLLRLKPLGSAGEAPDLLSLPQPDSLYRALAFLQNSQSPIY